MKNNHVILIGAMGVGKTSAAKEVSKRLGLKYIDIDELRWDYFRSMEDYDDDIVHELFQSSKETEAFKYLKPFEARYTVYILDKYKEGVFDFGAGYTVYEDENLFSLVKEAFEPYENVILLRYSSDACDSLDALKHRHADIPENLYDVLNKEFINSPCNEILAKHIIDTKGLSIDEAAEAILKIVQRL